MAQVYDVKVRFMRRMQIREYEPAESEVSISAQMGEDDDDLMTIGQELLSNARDLVKSALTGKTTGTATGKTQIKVTKKAAVDEIPEDDNEIPGDDDEELSAEEYIKAAAAKKRKVAAEKRKAKKLAEKIAAEVAEKKAAEEDEIPGGDDDEEIPGDDDEEEGSSEVSVDDLAAFINKMVTSRKVKPKQIKAVLAKYNASRISEVPAEDCGDAKKAIEKLAGA